MDAVPNPVCFTRFNTSVLSVPHFSLTRASAREDKTEDHPLHSSCALQRTTGHEEGSGEAQRPCTKEARGAHVSTTVSRVFSENARNALEKVQACCHWPYIHGILSDSSLDAPAHRRHFRLLTPGCAPRVQKLREESPDVTLTHLDSTVTPEADVFLATRTKRQREDTSTAPEVPIDVSVSWQQPWTVLSSPHDKDRSAIVRTQTAVLLWLTHVARRCAILPEAHSILSSKSMLQIIPAGVLGGALCPCSSPDVSSGRNESSGSARNTVSIPIVLYLIAAQVNAGLYQCVEEVETELRDIIQDYMRGGTNGEAEKSFPSSPRDSAAKLTAPIKDRHERHQEGHVLIYHIRNATRDLLDNPLVDDTMRETMPRWERWRPTPSIHAPSSHRRCVDFTDPVAVRCERELWVCYETLRRQYPHLPTAPHQGYNTTTKNRLKVDSTEAVYSHSDDVIFPYLPSPAARAFDSMYDYLSFVEERMQQRLPYFDAYRRRYLPKGITSASLVIQMWNIPSVGRGPQDTDTGACDALEDADRTWRRRLLVVLQGLRAVDHVGLGFFSYPALHHGIDFVAEALGISSSMSKSEEKSEKAPTMQQTPVPQSDVESKETLPCMDLLSIRMKLYAGMYQRNIEHFIVDIRRIVSMCRNVMKMKECEEAVLREIVGSLERRLPELLKDAELSTQTEGLKDRESCSVDGKEL